MFIDLLEILLYLFGCWLFIVFYALAFPDVFPFMKVPNIRESHIRLDLSAWIIKNIILKAVISAVFIFTCHMLFDSTLWFWIYSIPWILFFIFSSVNIFEDLFRKNYLIATFSDYE